MQRIQALLSAQRTLLGMITPSMRGVAIKYETQPLKLRIYFEKEPSEFELELLSSIGGEIIADYGDGSEIEEEAIVNNDKQSELDHLDAWVYLRAE